MSSKNRNRRHNQNPGANSSKPESSPQPSTTTGPRPPERVGIRHAFNWLLAVGALTTVINFFLAYFSYQQAKLSEDNVRVAAQQFQVAKETLDRSTGKVAAKFEFADFHPTAKAYRDDQKAVVFGLKDSPVPFYKDSNSMVLLPPTLYLNNTGADGIDAVRVEVSFLEGIIDRLYDKKTNPLPTSPPPDWYKVDTPVSLRKAEKEEHVLTQQWKPGQSLKVPLLRGVMSQLLEVQSRNATDKLHMAQLEFLVSARLTGSNVFSSNGAKMRYMVVWMPKGFPEEEVKRVLERYQPKLEIGAKIPGQIETHRGNQNDLLYFGHTPNYSNPKTLGNKR